MLIAAAGLGISRGERVLFRNVSFEASAGETLVLRGANGAGKTTLLRILAGLTQPEAGRVVRQGPHHWSGHRDGLKPHETPRLHLGVWGRAAGATVPVAYILERLALTRAADVAARDLSAGQRRRTGLGRLLLEARPIWLLDEPFTALDASGAALMQDLIGAHRAAGGAVIAALHGAAGFTVDREVVL